MRPQDVKKDSGLARVAGFFLLILLCTALAPIPVTVWDLADEWLVFIFGFLGLAVLAGFIAFWVTKNKKGE